MARKAAAAPFFKPHLASPRGGNRTNGADGSNKANKVNVITGRTGRAGANRITKQTRDGKGNRAAGDRLTETA